MSKPRIPTIDLRPWVDGDAEARAAIARTVDEALQTAGFLLVTGHGVDPGLRSGIREAARAFFRMPTETKQAYEAKVGGRGWLGPGAEANGYSEGTETPPDLKESLTFATHEPFEDPVVNAEWYAPNVWPAEVPALRELCEEYLERMAELEKRLLSLLGEALGLQPDFFSRIPVDVEAVRRMVHVPGEEVGFEPEGFAEQGEQLLLQLAHPLQVLLTERPQLRHLLRPDVRRVPLRVDDRVLEGLVGGEGQ